MTEQRKVQKMWLGSEHAELYKLEHQRQEIMHKIAKEWLEVTGIPQKEYWAVAIPTMLYDTLEAWDRQASICAAKAFLEAQEELDE